MKYFLCLIVLLPQLAQAQIDWRLTIRGGQTFSLDAGHDLVSSYPGRTGLEVSLDKFVLSPSEHSTLGLGVAYAFAAASDWVYEDIDTELMNGDLRAHALYRWSTGRSWAFNGRVGPVYRATALTLADGGGELMAKTEQWGVYGGLGFDYLFGDPSPVEMDELFVGFSMEMTYAYFPENELVVAGTSWGSLDTSGPGVLVGFTYIW